MQAIRGGRRAAWKQIHRGNETLRVEGLFDTYRESQRKRLTACVPGSLCSPPTTPLFTGSIPFYLVRSFSPSRLFLFERATPSLEDSFLSFFSFFFLLSRLFMRATGTHRQFNSVLGPPNQCAVLQIEGPFPSPFPWGWKGEPGEEHTLHRFRLHLGSGRIAIVSVIIVGLRIECKVQGRFLFAFWTILICLWKYSNILIEN